MMKRRSYYVWRVACSRLPGEHSSRVADARLTIQASSRGEGRSLIPTWRVLDAVSVPPAGAVAVPANRQGRNMRAGADHESPSPAILSRRPPGSAGRHRQEGTAARRGRHYRRGALAPRRPLSYSNSSSGSRDGSAYRASSSSMTERPGGDPERRDRHVQLDHATLGVIDLGPRVSKPSDDPPDAGFGCGSRDCLHSER